MTTPNMIRKPRPEIPEIPEIPIPELPEPQKEIPAREVSTDRVETETKTAYSPAGPKRRGRPPGSVNKTTKIAPPPKKLPDIPDFTEWQDFIAETVMHWLSRGFVAFAFRGMPEYRSMLSFDDLEDLELDSEQLNAIARPFASMAERSKINVKYGRAIMNSKDSIEAAVILFMWANRVNRIAKRVRNEMEVIPNVPRIPRPDRARDSTENVQPEIGQPIAAANSAAFGHGFN